MEPENKKIFIIYNPLSGRIKFNLHRIIKNYLEKNDIPYQWHNLKEDGSFEKKNPNDYKRIIAVGGDGTVKEAASWIIKNKSKTPLGIIPAGSANVLALTLGMPINSLKALKFAIEGDIQSIDVGQVNERNHFLIACGLGFDAKVIKYTNTKLKRVFGLLAYLGGIIKTLFSFKQPYRYSIKIDDEKAFKVSAQYILVNNISEIYIFKISPNIKKNDGWLNISIFRPFKFIDLFKIVYRILTRTYTKDWRFKYFKAKKIYISPISKEVPMHIDGDQITLPYFDIRILPSALNIISKK